MRNKVFRLLGRLKGHRPVAGRGVTVCSDDTFIVSYPKSGNTWTRFLIANILHDHVHFGNIEQLVPDIYVNDEKFLAKINHPRILKSHEYFDPKYSKVIYIVRDPRDVAISYYHHLIKFKRIDEDHSIGSFIPEFIAGKYGGMYGTWAQNVGSWIGACENNPNFLLLRYEDLLDGYQSLQPMVKFLGLNCSEDRVKNAYELSSVDNMKRLEKETGDQWKPLNKTRKTGSFVRSGRKGDGGIDETKKITKAWKGVMEKLRYID